MSTLGPSGSTPGPVASVVAEWVNKAQGDLDVAEREFAYQGHRNFDAVAFHAQQAVEKLMKAVLTKRGTTPPKTHDLEVLANQLAALGVGPVAAPVDLVRLSLAAVNARYPGCAITEAAAADLLRMAKSIWPVLRLLV